MSPEPKYRNVVVPQSAKHSSHQVAGLLKRKKNYVIVTCLKVLYQDSLHKTVQKHKDFSTSKPRVKMGSANTNRDWQQLYHGFG